jgi:hypothetical protein
MPKLMTPNAPYAWTAAELDADRSWQIDLPDAVLAELEALLPSLRQRALEELKPEDCPLPSFQAMAAELRASLHHGRGLVQLRRLPVERWDEADIARAYWVIGTHVGIGVSQSYKGDRLGHVRDIGEGGRYYTVGGSLEMHMDPVDVVGLLCVKPAVAGGESRIASSTSVRDAIAADYPDMIPMLEQGFHYTSRREDRTDGSPPITPHRLPVFAQIEDLPASFYLPLAVRNTETEGVKLSALEKDALTLVNTVAQRPELCFRMDLQPGEIQFLNNRLIFHGRDDYEDAVTFEDKRHMLRLWLMMPDWPPRPPEQDMHSHHDRAGGGIAARS